MPQNLSITGLLRSKFRGRISFETASTSIILLKASLSLLDFSAVIPQLIETRGVSFGRFLEFCPILSPMLTKNVVRKISKMFWRPKTVQISRITNYIYKLFPACQMFSDSHCWTERNAHCNIGHLIVVHKPIRSRNA